MNTTLTESGYVFNFNGRAFDPDGKLDGQPDQSAIDAHNRDVARRELDAMNATGMAILYLMESEKTVGSWDGSHKWQCHIQHGSHNIARTRIDVWFTTTDGSRWHGVNLGDNDIVRCKRLKS